MAMLGGALAASVSSVSAQVQVNGSISVDVTSSGRAFTALQYGSNATFFIPASTLTDPRLIQKTKQATSFLRYPGGQSSQLWGWASCELGSQYGNAIPCHPNRTDLVTPSQFARFAQATSMSEVVVTVNTNATAQENAAFVAFYNGNPADSRAIGVDQTGTDWKTVGFWAQQRVNTGITAPLGVRYWEFGNETYGGIVGDNNCLGYGWENTWSCDPVEIVRGTGSGASRKDGYRAQKAAMKAIDGSIQVGIPGVEAKNDQNNWSRRLLAEAGNEIDFLTVHPYYIYVPPENTPAGNAQILAYPQSHFAEIDNNFTTYERELGLNRQVPVLISEYNLTPNAYNDNNRRIEWMLNAMIMGDGVGQMAVRSRFLGVNEHTLFADNFNNTEYGLIKFDNDLSRMATYWAFALWKRFGSEVLPLNSSFNSSADLSVYAGRRNGKIVFYVINKSGSTQTARITLNGAARITGEFADTVVASSLSDTRPLFNGVANPSDDLSNAPGQTRSYSGGNSIDRAFPPTSITLLELTTDGTAPVPSTTPTTTTTTSPATPTTTATTVPGNPGTTTPTTSPTTIPGAAACATGNTVLGGGNTVQSSGCSIGDRVWNDANNNGLVDNGEAGIAGLNMMLLNGGSDTGQRVLTDANGGYNFGGLAAADGYRVCFEVPAGYAGSTGSGSTSAGQPDTSAPDPNNYLDNDDNGKTAGTLQCSGYIIVSDKLSKNLRVDFGLFAVGGVVPPPIAPTTPPTTAPTVPTVVPTLPTIAPTTTPTTTAAPSLPGRSIGNTVFNDRNNNGLQDSGEPGIGSVSLSLYDGFTFVKRTSTDSAGLYSFTDLPNNDNYQVCITNPTGYSNANGSGKLEAGQSDLIGADPNNYLDGDDNGRTTSFGHCSGFIIISDKLLKNERVDFGVFSTGATPTPTAPTTAPPTTPPTTAPPTTAPTTEPTVVPTLPTVPPTVVPPAPGYTLGNLVWNDRNNNGLRDSGEPGIAGVTATLFYNNERTATTSVTDASGEYSFVDLPASDAYQVCIAIPDGMVGSNGSNSTARGQKDAAASDPNNYVNDDDNGFYTRGLHCSGYIIVSAKLPSNQRVDFGLYSPDRAVSALSAVGYDPTGTRRVSGANPNFTQVLFQFPVEATLAAPTGSLSIRQVSGPAVTFTDASIANRTLNPNSPNGVAFGAVATIASPGISVVEVTYAGDAVWAPTTQTFTIVTFS